MKIQFEGLSIRESVHYSLGLDRYTGFWWCEALDGGYVIHLPYGVKEPTKLERDIARLEIVRAAQETA